MAPHDIDVIVVNYRTPVLSIRCVGSILDHEIASPSRITVVDDCSRDDSIERLRAAFPGVSLVASSANAGFAAGVNRGARTAKGTYLVVLNPDTFFRSDSVRPIVDLMRSDGTIGLVGLDLVNPDGTRQFSGRRFYSVLDVVCRRSSIFGSVLRRRIDSHLMKDAWEGRGAFDAEWVMGAGFVVRRDVFDQIGGMDESYHVYMEDVDLCAQVWRAGYRVVCLPGAQLIHDHQRASAASPFSVAGIRHMRSFAHFARKFHVGVVRAPGIWGTIGRTAQPPSHWSRATRLALPHSRSARNRTTVRWRGSRARASDAD
jgi:N-acetylglucosaminyl-diphospho-decaprenol L-rhamnosyltransferase